MTDYKATKKRSFLGTVFYVLIRLLGIKSKMAKNDLSALQSYEDVKTPVKKRFIKEVIGEVASYWINKEKSENGILVYLPGGGFIIGPTRLHWLYCERMSEKLDMAVLVIRYALAPQHPFPIGLDGIVNVITTLQNRSVLKQNWFLAGESAGGNLTLAACYQLHALKAALPKKLMLLYPSVDMTGNHNDPEVQEIIRKDIFLSIAFTNRVLAAYAGNHDLSDPLLSPVNGELTILPPILIQHGTADILMPGSRKLVQRLEKAGKPVHYQEYTDMFHGFILYPKLPEAEQAIRAQVKFIKN